MTMEFFSSADMLGKVFWLCAMGGTLFFVLRVILLVVAGDTNDIGDDLVIGHHSSDHAFEVFSVNSISAFIMMFGWAGLTFYLQMGLSAVFALGGALAVGVLAMYLTVWLFRQAAKLVSRGEEFKIERLVGTTATVYQQIPAQGTGKINASVPNGITRELMAVSEDKTAIASFQKVQVVKVVDQNTVSVRKI